MAAVTDIGFGIRHPSRTYSPALQQQISLFEGDRTADYILFDDFDRPVRFVIHDSFMRLCFHSLRADTIYGAAPHGLEIMAEYLIKTMAHQPGLSWERILAQFQSEYGVNMTEKMAGFEVRRVENGDQPGTTVLERMRGSLGSVMQGRFPEMNIR
jgi:hypothetical protein